MSLSELLTRVVDLLDRLDVRNILAVQGGDLDRSHVDLWTGRLGLAEAWRAIRPG